MANVFFLGGEFLLRTVEPAKHAIFPQHFQQMVEAWTDRTPGDGESRRVNQRADFLGAGGGEGLEFRFEFRRRKLRGIELARPSGVKTFFTAASS